MKKSLLFTVSLLFLGTFLLLGGFFVYSSSPRFCKSCHIMEPYYQSWQTSKHSDINCTVCHFEPGVAGTLRGKFQASALLMKYITGTYSPKPFANIKDASCLREGCHIRAELEKTKPLKGKASFNHQPHFRKNLQTSLTCTACHSPLMGNQHISVNESHCYLCHLKNIKTVAAPVKGDDSECVVCHRDLPKIIPLGKRNIEHQVLSKRKINCLECHSHVVKGRGIVPENRCFNCHDFVERAAVRKDLKKLHEIHVRSHIECLLCHEEIIHRIDPKSKRAGSDCKSCHLAKHAGVKTLYSGMGGRHVPDRPSPMYQAGVDCIGCHGTPSPARKSFKGQSLVAVKNRCIECHNDNRYGEILDRWKKLIKTRLAQVGDKLARAEKIAGGKPEEKEKMELLNDARYNYYFVKQSPGIHNVGYSENLLDASEQNLNVLLGISVANAKELKKRRGRKASSGFTIRKDLTL